MESPLLLASRSMARLLGAAVVALVACLGLTACGGGDDGAATTTPAPASESRTETGPSAEEADDGGEERTAGGESDKPGASEPQPTGTEIATAESQFGEVLFDGEEQAIYYFDLERDAMPRCYGECAAAWPPVLTDGEPRASGEVRQGLLGTTERRDGQIQVTYDGRPLYYYVDEGPGELRCHNIFHWGGLWLAVEPGGDAVPHDPAETISLD